ncbi:MAG: ACP S-malonyltransferase [Saprospiraceae bacterium]|nr:ACP S-malonyltransferase [Saprospiraceae bacterium]
MIAYVFPGQASQFVGMGQDLFTSSDLARMRYRQADEILGFEISKIMFEGSEEELRQTSVTQPAVFLHSVICAEVKVQDSPGAVAGHSLGEFSALVVNGVLSFEDGLKLVKARADSMQKACDLQPSTMAAIVGLDDDIVERICSDVEGIVVPANYNCPGQLVISGDIQSVDEACKGLIDAGARRAITLSVGGAFHSPYMQPAQDELKKAIDQIEFQDPSCPIYQNVDAKAHIEPNIIRDNLVKQLTSPVRWKATIEQMISDGVESFIEIGGTGKVLQGMIKRISRETNTATL